MKSPPAHLLIVGDSIALGVTEMVSDQVRGTAADCFVDRLRPRLPDWRISVDAALHRTSSIAVALLPELLGRHRPDVVLFVLGGNDLDINWRRFIVSKGRRVRPNTSVEAFSDNLRFLAETARAEGALPLLCDLPAPDVFERGRRMSVATGQDFVAVLQAIGGDTIAERLHGLFSRQIDAVAVRTNTPVVRWAARLATLPPSQRFGPDAVHPSETAHAVIADAVVEALASLVSSCPGASS